MLLFVPRLLVALLVIVFGSYFARFAGNAVQSYCRGAGIGDADLLGHLMRYGIMAFVILLAVDHLDIGGGLIQQTFLILLAGIVFALALSFGLGGRQRASSLIERWFPRDRGRQAALRHGSSAPALAVTANLAGNGLQRQPVFAVHRTAATRHSACVRRRRSTRPTRARATTNVNSMECAP